MEQKAMKSGRRFWMKYSSSILFLIGVVMVILGVVWGGPSAVLEKATRICLECIGIG